MRGEIIPREVNLKLSNLERFNSHYLYKFREDVAKKQGERILYIKMDYIKKAIIIGDFEFSRGGSFKTGRYGHLQVPAKKVFNWNNESDLWEGCFDNSFYINHEIFMPTYNLLRVKKGKDIVWGARDEEDIYNISMQRKTKIYLGNNIVDELINKIQQEF